MVRYERVGTAALLTINRPEQGYRGEATTLQISVGCFKRDSDAPSPREAVS